MYVCIKIIGQGGRQVGVNDSSAHEPIAYNTEGFVADGESERARCQLFYHGKHVHVAHICLHSIFQCSDAFSLGLWYSVGTG